MEPWMTVLTCSDRREYFAATMASIREAGGDSFPGEKNVFIDGTENFKPEDWSWYADQAPGWNLCSTGKGLLSPRIGTKPAMLHVLYQAAEASAPYLLYMEDDIVLSKNAIKFVTSMTHPSHLAFISFCDIKNIGRQTGITMCPGYDFEGPVGEGGHWGNQMLLIQGPALQYLKESTTFPDWRISIPDHQKAWPKKWEDVVLGMKASDIMLGVSLACSPAPWGRYGVFTPSLAQHIGERSLVNPLATSQGWGRDSLTWRGADFDSLMLEPQHHVFHEATPHWRSDVKTRMQIRFRGGNRQLNRTGLENKNGIV